MDFMEDHFLVLNAHHDLNKYIIDFFCPSLIRYIELQNRLSWCNELPVLLLHLLATVHIGTSNHFVFIL